MLICESVKQEIRQDNPSFKFKFEQEAYRTSMGKLKFKCRECLSVYDSSVGRVRKAGSTCRNCKSKQSLINNLQKLYPNSAPILPNVLGGCLAIDMKCEHDKTATLSISGLLKGRWKCACLVSQNKHDRLLATLSPLYPNYTFDVSAYDSKPNSKIIIECENGHKAKCLTSNAKMGIYSCQTCKKQGRSQERDEYIKNNIRWAEVKYVGHLKKSDHLYEIKCKSCKHTKTARFLQLKKYFKYCMNCNKDKFKAVMKDYFKTTIPEREKLFLAKINNNARRAYAGDFDSVAVGSYCSFKCLDCGIKYARIARNILGDDRFSGRCNACEPNSDSKRGIRHRVAKAYRHAKAYGKLTYLGSTCKKCNKRKRYTLSSSCVKCRNTYTKEQLIKEMERYYRNHKARRAAGKKHYENNTALYRKLAKRWIKNNPEAYRTMVKNNSHRRRMRKEQGMSTKEFRVWYTKRSEKCYYCRVECKDKFHVDHYIPLAKGGQHIATNLRVSCISCNLQKSARMPEDWYDTMLARDIKPSKRFTKLICESV